MPMARLADQLSVDPGMLPAYGAARRPPLSMHVPCSNARRNRNSSRSLPSSDIGSGPGYFATSRSPLLLFRVPVADP